MSNRYQAITLRNVETGDYSSMSLRDVIENINRDRSEHWTDYDETDWREGLAVFTEYELVT